ncbi:hypothetical protein I656_04054 [Geobacillus sp. WSUCF1]|nr:hypothetical protein I656_04054 [Geobacillus sp. WSUCF1]
MDDEADWSVRPFHFTPFSPIAHRLDTVLFYTAY